MSRCTVAEAWDAAAGVVGSAYRVDPAALMAMSRGRGPRPPEHVREPRKLCLYIAVLLSGHDYKAVGGHLGLHKDTSASHCAEMRERCTHDGGFEERVQALEDLARERLLRTPQIQPGFEAGSLEARIARLEEAMLGTLHPTAATLHPTGDADHGNVSGERAA